MLEIWQEEEKSSKRAKMLIHKDKRKDYIHKTRRHYHEKGKNEMKKILFIIKKCN